MSPSRGYIPGGFGGAPPQPPQSSSSSNMNVVVEPGCQLYIGNLSWETGWQELKDYFRQCGDVERSEVAEGNDGRKRGFGIIRYRTAREAMNAIETLNGVEFMGRPLEVRLDNRA
jgi:RNA recognition motif-containing protein